MSPEYWKLDASVSAKQRAVAVDSIDVAQLAAELAELADLFNQEKTYTVGGVEHTSAAKVAVDLQRDLDGTAGNGERLLVPQILDDSAKLVEHAKGWPIIGGKVRAMVDWMELWGELVSDESFRKQCRITCTLVELLQAIPNGSVENERGFSALNRLMDRLRNALQSYHLNVVLVLHNQKELLAPYSPVIVDFVQRWFKGERGEAAGAADRAGSAVDNTAASGALEGAAAASGATASGTAASGGVASGTAATPGESDGDDIILGGEWANPAYARFADRNFR